MNPYFSGLYLKQRGENGAVALIPAVHRGADGHETASLQLVTAQGAHCVFLGGVPVETRRGLCRFGPNRFSTEGVHLELASGALVAAGDLRFRGLTPPRGDAMGPFRFLPFMECSHAVYSLRHAVDGCLTINGRTYFFDGGEGYMEGDAGRSFPKRYLWTQCLFERGSLMLSVADIPYLGLRFTGVLGLVLYKGKQIRIATDRGARVERLGDGGVVVRQGAYRLWARRLSAGGTPLKAPSGGDMTRTIREQLCCRARYRLDHAGKTLFAFESAAASFEFEY